MLARIRHRSSAKIAVALVLILVAGLARAEGFKPGNVFVSHPSYKFCYGGSGTIPPDRIWQIDPETGEAWVFAVLAGADCGFITGLAVSPDGCRLRAAQSLTERILEFAPDGTWTVALDESDGILDPHGTNCLAYDAQGNFYVVDPAVGIHRFPADGGPGTVFADADDGVGRTGGSIAFSANGDLYLANWAPDWVIRITPDGSSSLFADYRSIGSIWSIAADARGYVYWGLSGADEKSGLYRFKEADPSSGIRFSSNGLGALGLAAYQTEMYGANPSADPLFAMRLGDGAVRVIVSGFVSYAFGQGIAVVPVTAGDINRDRLINIADWSALNPCVQGPQLQEQLGACPYADLDHDEDVDLADIVVFQQAFGNSAAACG